MGFYEDFLHGLDRVLEDVYDGNRADFARACGVDAQRIKQYHNRDRVQYVEKLGQVIDGMGARLVFPDQDDSRGKRDFVRHALERMLETPEFYEEFMEMVNAVVQQKMATAFVIDSPRDELRQKVANLPDGFPEDEHSES